MKHKNTHISIDITSDTGGGQFNLGEFSGLLMAHIVSSVQSWQNNNPKKEILFITFWTDKQYFLQNNDVEKFQFGQFNVQFVESNQRYSVNKGNEFLDDFHYAADAAIDCIEKYIESQITQPIKKSKGCTKVLQLMDQDLSYEAAVYAVVTEYRTKIEKELFKFI
jgi:hypothetical protein